MNETCTNLLTDGLRDPLGIDATPPYLTWQLPDLEPEKEVTHVQVRVSRSSAGPRQGQDLLWDSGETAPPDPCAMLYEGEALPVLTPVYWSVRCWVSGEAEPREWAAPAQFELGLGPDESAWAGSKWIARQVPKSLNPSLHAPLLRRRFALSGGSKITRARLSVATPAFCYAWLNEKPVMDRVCDPMRADSSQTIHYRTLDVTAQLGDTGTEQVLALWLGSGFYSPFYETTEHPMPVVRALLTIYRQDGSQETLGTDDQWKSADSPVILTQSYYKKMGFGGEIWDMGQDHPGWTGLAHEDAAWESAVEVSAPSGRLTAQPAFAHGVRELFKPQEVRRLDPERILVDFGRTLTGRVRLRFRPRPQLAKVPRVRLRHAEVWPPEMPAREEGGSGSKNLDYGQVNEWLECPGKNREAEVEWAPLFHIFCFRYVEIEIFAADLDWDTGIEAEFLSSDLDDAGSFETDDPLLNRIEAACAHTWRCLALYGGSLDCSHREKDGWGGEAEANAEFFLQRFDSAPFLRRFLKDWRDAQDPDGRLPNYAPAWGGAKWVGGPFYSQAPIQLAWFGYLHSGDPRFLSENLEMALSWADYLAGSLREGLIDPATYLKGETGRIHPIAFIGDWLAPKAWMDVFKTSDFQTNGELDLDSPTVHDCLRQAQIYNGLHAVVTFKNIRRMAKVLGREADVEARVAEPLRAMCAKLVNDHVDLETGQVGNGRQAYAALALVADPFSEVPAPDQAEDLRAKVLQWLKRRIVETDNHHFDTGVLATTYLLKVLVLHGEVDLALDLLQQTDFPSFGYFFEKGFDAIPEQWAGHGSSFCHASFSGAAFWFTQALGGIRPREDGPGWRRFDLAPQFTTRLAHCQVARNTTRGQINLSWKWQDPDRQDLVLSARIPAGAIALLQLPAGYHSNPQLPSTRLESGEHTLHIQRG